MLTSRSVPTRTAYGPAEALLGEIGTSAFGAIWGAYANVCSYPIEAVATIAFARLAPPQDSSVTGCARSTRAPIVPHARRSHAILPRRGPRRIGLHALVAGRGLGVRQEPGSAAHLPLSAGVRPPQFEPLRAALDVLTATPRPTSDRGTEELLPRNREDRLGAHAV